MSVLKFFGGVLPTADPEYVINHKNINYIAVGEGEITLKELAESCLQKRL